MHTGDAEERELFERLERELRDVKVPRTPLSREPRLPRSRRLLSWFVVVGLGLWSLQNTDTGRGLLAPVTGWLQQVSPAEAEYTFLQETASGPVRWSSCREVRVVVNDALRPLDAWDVVERGLAEVAEASGLSITIVGRTDEAPSAQRAAEQPRYGMGWAPVLIAWTTPDVVPGLAGDTVGLGGGASLTQQPGPGYYVSGQISLDAPQLEDILALPGGEAQAKAVVMHEMAHVLGLGHVDSSAEVMAEGYGASELGPGDIAGLKVAGNGPCI